MLVLSVSAESEISNLRAGIHPVFPLWRGSHFRVPAHHHPDHMTLPLHHYFSNPQKHVRWTGAADCLGGCKDKGENPVRLFLL